MTICRYAEGSAMPHGVCLGLDAGAFGRVRDVSERGLPLLKPPYGTIAAIDLTKGEVLWEIPNGDTPEAITNHPAPRGREGRPHGFLRHDRTSRSRDRLHITAYREESLQAGAQARRGRGESAPSLTIENTTRTRGEAAVVAVGLQVLPLACAKLHLATSGLERYFFSPWRSGNSIDGRVAEGELWFGQVVSWW